MTIQPLLSFKDVAEITGKSEKTYYNLNSEGKLPFPVIKLGRSVRVHPDDLLKYLEENRQNK